MTVITGTVTDTSGRPLNGTLTAAVGHARADGTVLYFPEPVPYRITGGHVTADLVPGPARLTIRAGGTQTFHVTIPTTGPVTLASLIGDT